MKALAGGIRSVVLVASRDAQVFKASTAELRALFTLGFTPAKARMAATAASG